MLRVILMKLEICVTMDLMDKGLWINYVDKRERYIRKRCCVSICYEMMVIKRLLTWY